MNYLYIFLIFLSVFFPQSIFNRIIVPIYIESEFSYGHDDNYLKLSLPEQENDLEYRLGDSERIYSDIIKNKINIMYSPYINHHHETRVDFTITTSKYESSDLKSYNNYFLKLSQHLAPYTWLKFQYSYTPSFYIKSYSQSDPYIAYELQEDDYMPSSFLSEKYGLELSLPIPYLNKTYFSIRWLFESQYYNADFTEFDLEITNYYYKIRKKILNHFNLSIAYMQTQADNITYMNGLLSTSDKDRSYIQDKVYASFSISDFYFFGKKISSGIYSSYESRNFTSNLEEDKLHFKRLHNDMSVSYWLKRHLNNHFDIKIKGVYRKRATFSPYYIGDVSVSDFKSFEKFEVWLSIIFRMELSVY